MLTNCSFKTNLFAIIPAEILRIQSTKFHYAVQFDSGSFSQKNILLITGTASKPVKLFQAQSCNELNVNCTSFHMDVTLAAADNQFYLEKWDILIDLIEKIAC